MKCVRNIGPLAKQKLRDFFSKGVFLYKPLNSQEGNRFSIGIAIYLALVSPVICGSNIANGQEVLNIKTPVSFFDRQENTDLDLDKELYKFKLNVFSNLSETTHKIATEMNLQKEKNCMVIELPPYRNIDKDIVFYYSNSETYNNEFSASKENESSGLLEGDNIIQDLEANPPADYVVDGIVVASQEVGLDPTLLLSIAWLESHDDPKISNHQSTAKGLYQFTNESWFVAIYRFGGKHGLEWMAKEIKQTQNGGVVVNPRYRKMILALRENPSVSSVMVAETLKEDGEELSKKIGRPANIGDLYLLHVLGPSGAYKFISAVDKNPNISSAEIVPVAVKSNPGLFKTSKTVLPVWEAHKRVTNTIEKTKISYREMLIKHKNKDQTGGKQHIAHHDVAHKKENHKSISQANQTKTKKISVTKHNIAQSNVGLNK